MLDFMSFWGAKTPGPLSALRRALSVFERKIPLIFSLEFRFHQDHA
jgi:hypothetical protein